LSRVPSGEGVARVGIHVKCVSYVPLGDKG